MSYKIGQIFSTINLSSFLYFQTTIIQRWNDSFLVSGKNQKIIFLIRFYQRLKDYTVFKFKLKKKKIKNNSTIAYRQINQDNVPWYRTIYEEISVRKNCGINGTRWNSKRKSISTIPLDAGTGVNHMSVILARIWCINGD